MGLAELILLTDGSVNPQSKIGYGAYLAVSNCELPLEDLQTQVRVQRFEQTSSTSLELQTLLWALGEIQPPENMITVYTDSQNIINLPARRAQLERNDYRSHRNRRLNNYALYQEFFRLTDQIECQFCKVPGHLPAKQKDNIARLFSLVDKASRKALREAVR